MNYLYTHSTCILWAVDRVGASHADKPYPNECYLDVLNKASKALHGEAKLAHKTVRTTLLVPALLPCVRHGFVCVCLCLATMCNCCLVT